MKRTGTFKVSATFTKEGVKICEVFDDPEGDKVRSVVNVTVGAELESLIDQLCHLQWLHRKDIHDHFCGMS
jgi:hypothetical protein